MRVTAMANLTDYWTDDGKKRFLAVIRIKGFKRTSRAFDSLRDAQEWARTTEAELRGLRDRGGARMDVTTLTIADLAVAYLKDPKVRALRSLPDVERMLGAWVSEYAAQRLRAFGYLHITAFRDQLLGTGLSPARTNRYLSAMRSAWNWGTPHYVQTPWPQRMMLEEPTPEAVNERYGTTDATLEDVHAVIAATDQVSPALGNLTRFLIGTGARLSDALAVTWRDVDKKAGTVAIQGKKTRRPQRVAMLAPALDAIERAGTLRNIADNHIFWQFKNRTAMRSQWKRAHVNFPPQMPKLRLHDCRHLCASFLAAAGASNVELMAQLGHRTLDMVARYSHIAGGHRGAAHDKLDAAFNASAKK
jgi:integrase